MTNWEYQQTSVHVKDDSKATTSHMNEMASAGWELVSAAPIFVFAIDTTQARGIDFGGPLPWGVVTSNGASHHCFYWRRASR